MADDEAVELDRINQNWPKGLKDEIKAKMGNARGVVTDFTVEAIRVRLREASALVEYEAQLKTADSEISELRYLVQQLADRYVIGGDHDDRETFLMELQLPAWLSTEGWPADLAAQKPIRDPRPEPVNVPSIVTSDAPLTVPQEKIDALGGFVKPTQAEVDSFVARAEAITGIPDMAVPPGTAAHEVKIQAVAAAEEAMAAPPTEPDVEVTEESVVFAHGKEPLSDYDDHQPMFLAPSSNDFLARVQAKGAEKGIDVSGLGLIPASKVPVPDKVIDANPHNHAWASIDGALRCECGAWIDKTDPAFPQGIVRDQQPEAAAGQNQGMWTDVGLHRDEEVPTEPAPVLDVPLPEPTPVAPRELAQFEVDF